MSHLKKQIVLANTFVEYVAANISRHEAAGIQYYGQ